MTNNPNDMLDKIPIPNELDERIELGFESARKYRNKKRNRFKKSIIGIAASLLIVIGSMGIIGFDKVEAAIKQVLQYVPGYNVVLESDDGGVLVLKDRVFYEEDGLTVNITAASKLNGNFNIHLEINYPSGNGEYPNRSPEIQLKDEANNIYSTNSWAIGGGKDFWSGDFYFEVEDGYSNYSIILEGMEIPFSLEKGSQVKDFLQLGNHASDRGIDIVAIKKPLEDGLMISLLNQSQDKIVYDYPFEQHQFLFGSDYESFDFEKSMYIIDNEGNKAFPTLPSSYGNLMSDFNFNIPDKEGLKLVLPYVKVQYPNMQTDRIRIKTPKDGERQEINEVVSLGNSTINIIDVRQKDEVIILRLESHSLEDEILEEVFIRANYGYAYGYDPQSGDFELFINVEDVGRRFSLSFESPIFILLGDWVIDLE